MLMYNLFAECDIVYLHLCARSCVWMCVTSVHAVPHKVNRSCLYAAFGTGCMFLFVLFVYRLGKLTVVAFWGFCGPGFAYELATEVLRGKLTTGESKRENCTNGGGDENGGGCGGGCSDRCGSCCIGVRLGLEWGRICCVGALGRNFGISGLILSEFGLQCGSALIGMGLKSKLSFPSVLIALISWLVWLGVDPTAGTTSEAILDRVLNPRVMCTRDRNYGRAIFE